MSRSLGHVMVACGSGPGVKKPWSRDGLLVEVALVSRSLGHVMVCLWKWPWCQEALVT